MMEDEQLDLFGMVRRDDHDTSIAAAESIYKKRDSIKRKVIYEYTLEFPNTMTDAQLDRRCTEKYGPRPESSYRKRRSELIEPCNGQPPWIIDSNKREMEAGSRVVAWILNPIYYETACKLFDISKKTQQAPAPPVETGGNFDPQNHPCVICGKPHAPWGYDYPRAPKFYCTEHRPK